MQSLASAHGLLNALKKEPHWGSEFAPSLRRLKAFTFSLYRSRGKTADPNGVIMRWVLLVE